MSKLSPAQVEALRHLAVASNSLPGQGRTARALAARFLIAPIGTRGSQTRYEITRSGKDALEEHERAERKAAEQAERAARPVPPDAFVGPSAKSAPPMPVDYEDDPEGETPAVPQAWIDQLVILLDTGARIVRDERGWYASGRMTVGCINRERLAAAVREAIRQGIAHELPPTFNGTVRLALTDCSRWISGTHPYKSHPYRSECRVATLRDGRWVPCGLPAKDPIHR